MLDTTPPNLNKKYDFIFSIGAACSCTQSLRSLRLQVRSLPFDWLYGCGFVDRCRLIASDFSTWLIKDELEYMGCRTSSSPHRYVYKNKLTGMTFNHDFFSPLSDESFENVKAKYNRRIDRLMSSIGRSKRVLAVYIDVPTTSDALSDDELIEGYNILCSKFPDVVIDILYIHNDDKVPYDERVVESLNAHIHKQTFCYNAFCKNLPHTVNSLLLKKALVGIRLSYRNLTLADILRWRKLKKFIYSSKYQGNGICEIRILGVRLRKKHRTLTCA